MTKKGFDLNWISRYRDELFGLAILSVMVFHFSMLHVDYYGDSRKLMFQVIKYIRWYIASGGVDVFVFLSGMGLYYSFSRNSDIRRFYGRRFRRILIPYFIVGGIFIVRRDLIYWGAGIKRAMKDFFYVTFFTEGINNLWFVFFIGVMYLIFPLLYSAIYRSRTGKLNFVLLLAAAVAFPIILSSKDPELFRNINMAITRLPVFIAGIFAGRYIKEGRCIPHAAAIIIAIFLCSLKFYAVHNDIKGWQSRYISSLAALGTIVICVYLLRAFDGAKPVRELLRFFGRYSLEFYLLHILMWEICAEYGVPLYRASRYGAMICVCMVLAPLLSRLTGKIDDLMIREKTYA